LMVLASALVSALVSGTRLVGIIRFVCVLVPSGARQVVVKRPRPRRPLCHRCAVAAGP
jgi:ABC-type Fe3+-siderophore transport system permease subunit